ncbi:uncharacterized protein LOC136089879 [Hydra vulgaris]|uniref:Uncharacterized protein LOC136089879 n=1 Tax=Hydra vulgaris TaxID=6087 RepID=A0ABM4DCD9_HYDVU
MAGAYNGFTIFLEKASPGHTHTWCYAHVLNLVVCDATSSNEASMTLFGILQKAAMFFRESYLRMDLWTDHMKEKNGQNIHKRLNVIGATRWGSKHDALQKFFGTFFDGEGALYTDVVQVLEIAVSSTKLSVEARYDAQCLLTSLLKYKTVLTGFVYLRIMESTTPLSKYLQTSGLNFIKAFEMVKITISEIQTQSLNFDQAKVVADHFINVPATILDEKECDCVIQTDLPMVRKRIRKVMAGELANDDPLTDPLKKFEVEVHNGILDTVLRSLSTRFASHGELYSDMSCFDPNGFSELLECNIPKKALQKISCHISATGEEAQLLLELLDFAKKWPVLKKTLEESYHCSDQITIDEDEVENEDDATNHKCGPLKKCRSCIYCCYHVLRKYNLYGKSYCMLHRAYKFMLTISITQVACERSFSKLKCVKTRLRSQLTEDHLDSLLMMCIEKHILSNITNDETIDELAKSSGELKKLLFL